MKIAVNLLPIREKLGGGGKYSQMILSEISKIDIENDYYLFVSEKGKINFQINKKNFKFIIANFNPESVLSRIFWEQIIFPIKLKLLKPDLVFVPAVAIPFLFKGKFLTTIHDIAYKKNKLKYSWLRSKYISFVTAISLKKSDTIFTVSDFSKHEIENEFKVKQKKILITYNGVNEGFFKVYDQNQILDFKKRFNLPNKFILYVGAIEPGKNLDKLFIAFSILSEEYTDFRLVLTSGIGWSQSVLFDLIDKLNLRSKIIFLPYIQDKELPFLYKSATLLAYLSEYEGFGIPVLEAMASGIPVITSNSDAIKEFAGDAVLSVNPSIIEEVVSGLRKIIDDTKYNEQLVKTGLQRARNFTWNRSAQIILDRINSYNANNRN